MPPCVTHVRMGKKTGQTRPGTDTKAREDRLKAALKANIARRKAQARARNDKQSEK